jgi:hypothetical protein
MKPTSSNPASGYLVVCDSPNEGVALDIVVKLNLPMLDTISDI